MGSGKSRPPSWDSSARRERYGSDEEYRQGVRARERRRYRERKHGDARAVWENETKYGLRDLPKLSHNFYGARYVSPSGVATVMGRGQQMLSRWVRQGMFPAPAHETDRGMSYTLDEARAVLLVMVAHFDEFSYYRRDHADTRERVWAAYNDAQS